MRLFLTIVFILAAAAAEAAERRTENVILVTLDGDRQTYEAIDAEGHVFDRYGPIAGVNRAAGDVPAGAAAADQ